MGGYDRKRFRQIMVDAELYRQLSSARLLGESFGDVIRRLMGEGSGMGTKKGRSYEELRALGRIARHAWKRKLETGQVKIVDRG